jgi:hypothetical protein
MNIVDFIDLTVKRSMYTDISTTIRNGLPVITAIGLFAYSEMIGGLGRIVEGEPEAIVFGSGQSNKNYAKYLKMAGKCYSRLNSRETYRIIRGGLIHRYFIRQRSTIEIDPSDPFCKKIEYTGCAIRFDEELVYFNVNRYFLDFMNTVERLRKKICRKGIEKLSFAEHINETEYVISRSNKTIR